MELKNTAIVYGKCNTELKMRALRLLSEQILEYNESYPICVKCGDEKKLSDYVKIYVGTKEDNAYIAENSKYNLSRDEEYAISVNNGIAIIEGSDEKGVLYGCADFYNKYLINAQYTDDYHTCRKNPFSEKLPNFEYTSHPAVENRGIWTWGDVIYDYRAFIDNMVKLKMNSLIIWNDEAPVNGKELVDYAHSCGVKIIWGYAWGWDIDCKKTDISSINDSIPKIVEKYEKDYLPLGGDGIYFQSFTEVHEEEIDGVLIAKAVTEFVNNASRELLGKYPDLELKFGLHAMSVKEKLDYIKNVDRRVRIVWEDCGAFPFAYMPHKTENFDETSAFVEKISSLRGENDKFGAVTKGICARHWGEFKHCHGPVYIGVSSKKFRRKRESKKEDIWKYVQSGWLTNAEYAARAIKLMADKKNGKLIITGLIEDAMFEETVMLPSAVYSELLWNPEQDINKLIGETARRSYVEFA